MLHVPYTVVFQQMLNKVVPKWQIITYISGDFDLMN